MLKLLLALVFLGGCAYADDPHTAAAAKKAAPGGSAVSADRFSCVPPAGWEVTRDRAKEGKTRIQKLELAGPGADKAPVLIYAAFYGAGNTSFAGYEDFIERNSKNILGETVSETEKFSPVKKITLSGKKAFKFDSEIKEYLHPESKSEESVVIKEDFYVVPAGDGFFVLHYYSPASAFKKHLPVFKKFVAACKLR
jgi:hypothetical protein